MKMHIIGVGTTFMSGLAILARQAGHEVSGSDSCFDLPTRTKLTEAGVILKEGFSTANLDDKPELVIIGNDIAITNEELVETRRRAVPYISGVLWLEEYILHDKWTNMVPAHHDDEPFKKLKKSTAVKTTDKALIKHAPKPSLDPNSKLKSRIVR